MQDAALLVGLDDQIASFDQSGFRQWRDLFKHMER
jgi:hypothetical protein